MRTGSACLIKRENCLFLLISLILMEEIYEWINLVTKTIHVSPSINDSGEARRRRRERQLQSFLVKHDVDGGATGFIAQCSS